MQFYDQVCLPEYNLAFSIEEHRVDALLVHLTIRLRGDEEENSCLLFEVRKMKSKLPD